MEFTFDADYNERLYEVRHVGFETVLEAIARKEVLFDSRENGDERHRGVLGVAIGDIDYYVPYAVADKTWILETVYPATELNQSPKTHGKQNRETGFLNDEEKEIVGRLRRIHPGALGKPSNSTLSEMKRAATKLLKRLKKGAVRISSDGPPGAKEHFGEIAGRIGKVGRW